MSGNNRRRVSATGQSPQSPRLYQHADCVSPTQRVSSKSRSSYTSEITQASARATVPRKISRNNPPQINTDIAKSQFAAMNSAPQTPPRRNSRGPDIGGSPLVNPTSAILQDLIKEQRATRSARKTASDSVEEVVSGTPPTSQSQSQEETSSEKQKMVNSAFSAGLKQPREMGIREMDQYVSKMNKLNFDLKLEIFHRSQQMAALEKKLERMHALEEELERMRDLEEELEELREVEENNQRLREANEQLQLELDKRDQAINEAVELICQLEAKIEELQANRMDSQPSTAQRRSCERLIDVPPEVSTPKAQIIVDIPDRTSSKRGTSRPPRKAPSFLREENRSTAALRSLYLADENRSLRSFSASTMTTSMESTESTAEPQSPRLSILSECSYFSPQDAQPGEDGFDQLDRLDELDFIAAPKPISNAAPSENSKSVSEKSQIDRINCWIQPQQEPSRSTAPRRRGRTVSEISRGTQSRVDEAFQSRPHPTTLYADSPSRHKAPPIFGGRLPPTPDTMSTSLPGAGSGSNDSFVAEKRAPDHTVPDSPFSMQKRLDRPLSAGDIRPSTAISGVSDSVETTMTDATQHAMSIRGRSEVPGLLRSFNFFGRGSSKATRLLGPGSPSNPRLSCYGGDLLFNGEGVEENVSETKSVRTPSFRSIAPSFKSNASEARSTPLPSSPPPLSPQEWLEAAKPQSKKERNTQAPKKAEPQASVTNLSSSGDSSSSTDEPQLPRNPLRLRAWANSPQQTADTRHRRRLSLRPRFFSRSGARQQQDPMSDPVDPPSPALRKHSDMVVARHRRADSGPVSENITTRLGADGASRPTGNRAISRSSTESPPSPASRPVTSDSTEPPRRRGSIFGFLKGATGLGSQSKEAEPTGTTTSTAPGRDKGKSSVAPATDATGRSGLGLAPAAALNNDTTVSKQKPAEEEPEWKARRRSRRMA
ncbi:hypothetical protein VTN77DRAFT_6146 [Rasamsonia byssochlamydoides]|uniref:uncharacterized protein n=1 Tax=Rasamsonia byssochlamydoides TaxID=89139 RepID=UPI0037432DDD